MFGKLISNILMAFMKPKIDNAANQLRNDSDINDSFKQLEIALQDLKDATEKKREYFNSEEHQDYHKRVLTRLGKRALNL